MAAMIDCRTHYRYARSGTGIGPEPAEQPQDHRPSFAEAHATSALGQGDVDGARATKTDQPAASETSRPANTTSADDMKVLLAMVMGNHFAAGRLIDFEQRKIPALIGRCRSGGQSSGFARIDNGKAERSEPHSGGSAPLPVPSHQVGNGRSRCYRTGVF
ncbi:hypothetical protein [Nocardia sp. NPDC023988]|uniref:hypothetical protein n=1 Tax=unclassified Nocardia TaxID=2637762 RepID=UPI0033C73B39